ncbi:MAG: hypothetical protein IT232_00400 [Flavobacteriales bacterium]|nr:hypothetical protein [Flavobacteriales bacterium]
MKKNIIDSTKIIILSTIVVLGASYIYAWTGPSNSAPNGNTPAPLNIGSGYQIKSGTLALTGLQADGLTAAATAFFVGNGKVRIQDLAGTSTRMVVVNEDGVLSTQPIPSSPAPVAKNYVTTQCMIYGTVQTTQGGKDGSGLIGTAGLATTSPTTIWSGCAPFRGPWGNASCSVCSACGTCTAVNTPTN